MEDHGLIHEKLDIKILILFILQRLPDAVPPETLWELSSCDSGVGYFDYAESLAELVETDHVLKGKAGYRITEKGKRNGSIIESSIPYSVRSKAERLIAPIATAMSRDSMIKTGHRDAEGGGCIVELSMSDNKSDIITLSLLAPGEDQSIQMERRFRRDAENIYNSIVEMLLKD